MRPAWIPPGARSAAAEGLRGRHDGRGAPRLCGPCTWYYRTIAKYVAPPPGQAAIKSYELYSKTRSAAETLDFEELANSPLMVCGDVDHCVEKLTRLRVEFGFDELLCWTRIGGLENRKVLHSMELMSGLVMPRVRQVTALAA